MNSTHAVSLRGVAEGPVPEVLLLDARPLRLSDEAALREHARRANAASAAPFASRSYCFPFALLALHTSQVGVDIERVSRCDEVFAESIRTPAERAGGWPQVDGDRFFASLWAARRPCRTRSAMLWL